MRNLVIASEGSCSERSHDQSHDQILDLTKSQYRQMTFKPSIIFVVFMRCHVRSQDVT